EASKLAESLQKVRLSNGSVKFIFQNTIQHRATLILRGPHLSTAIGDSDPYETGKKVLEVKPLDNSPEASFTARVLNELLEKFHHVLRNHEVNRERIKRNLPPANIILCRGAGTIPNVKPLGEIYGIKSACIAVVSLIRGVCKIAGMNLLNVEGATGSLDTDYMAKAKVAVQALQENDLVVLHIKATDVASHDGNFYEKVKVIEKIDMMISYILDNIDHDDVYVTVTADHTTSCLTRKHEGDPVPVAIMGPYVRRDDVIEYNERSCARGGLGRIRGIDLMPILMNFIGKTKKFGA
ncbi:MAG: phosphoglycerate mutase, partial [Candidatus Bathyarchaeia archaeon]